MNQVQAQKKNFSNINTSQFIDGLKLKDITSKAIAKSNADTIVAEANKAGVDPIHYLKMAASETRLGTDPNTGKKGLFQITDGSYKLLKQKYPDEMTGLNRNKTIDNLKMAMLLGKSDSEDFQKATGKEPTAEEQRLLHVLGLGATKDIVQNEGRKVAARTLSTSLQKAAENNREFFVTKDNKNASPSLVRANILKDYNRWDKYLISDTSEN